MKTRRRQLSLLEFMVVVVSIGLAVFVVLGVKRLFERFSGAPRIDERSGTSKASNTPDGLKEGYRPRLAMVDVSGFMALTQVLPRWKPDVSLEELCNHWRGAGNRAIDFVDRELGVTSRSDQDRLSFSCL